MPLLDRIDLCVEARGVSFEELTGGREEESSAEIRERVNKAHKRQKARYRGSACQFNSELSAADVKQFCRLTKEEERWMAKVYDSLSLTARSYNRILKVARTIADLDEEEQILPRHLSEAVSLRAVDRRYWDDALRN
jgi:magnesium chelatase family protein